MWDYLIDEVSKVPCSSNQVRNPLFDCATAAYHINRSSEMLDTYFENIDCPINTMRFSVHDSIFFFSLAYYSETKLTGEELKDLNNIANLAHAYKKLDREASWGCNVDRGAIKAKMRACVTLMVKGINGLLAKELKKSGILESISGVEDKLGYLAHVTNIPHDDVERLSFIERMASIS